MIPIAHLNEERRHELISIEWQNHIAQAMENELDAIIEDNRLRPEETRELMVEAFEAGGVPQEGVAVAKVLRPVSRFAKGNPHAEQRRRVTDLLTAFYERFRSFTDVYPRVDSRAV